MGKKLFSLRICLLSALTFFICFTFLQPVFAKNKLQGNELDGVINQLIHDGFDPALINQIYSKESVQFSLQGAATFFSYFESSEDPYLKFTKPDAINDAKKYMAKYKNELELAQQKYGVDKTVITAILLLESWLGTYPIEHPAVNILSTIAALKDTKLRPIVWEAIPKKSKPPKKKFTRKIEKRYKWGYNELKALIKYTQREGFEIEKINGSFAGAIGYAQFMPSNALVLAKDGNNDGTIDLFTHADAIFSIANYLKKHGWKPGIARQKQHEVLFRYNHSNYYVDTLLKVSDKLKG